MLEGRRLGEWLSEGDDEGERTATGAGAIARSRSEDCFANCMEATVG